MSKAFIATVPADPYLTQYAIPSSEALGGPTMSGSENSSEDNAFAFSEHWLTRYYQQDLWQQHPLLFLLLVYYARQRHWSDQQWRQCCQQSLQSLLAAIELPAIEANYRVLMDTIESNEIDRLLNLGQPELAALYQFFKSDSASLLAGTDLHQTITHMLQRSSMSEVPIAF
ncbi:hypothetical protein [Methylobacter luteus]|uniref:hypothetical protein n=1 Tax=Methylobacter luteus TaxID=415 RepID=UPI0004849C37|nr:hypothetical protein [Methylobacter luteus]